MLLFYRNLISDRQAQDLRSSGSTATGVRGSLLDCQSDAAYVVRLTNPTASAGCFSSDIVIG